MEAAEVGQAGQEEDVQGEHVGEVNKRRGCLDA